MSNFLYGDRLDNNEVDKKIHNAAYLKGHKPSEDIIRKIILTFWFHDNYISFISSESRLNSLVNYLNLENLQTFNRYDYYRYLFSSLIKDSDKRVALQKLALLFEQLQTDSVPLTKLNELLTSVGANNLISVEWLTNNNLGKVELKEKKEIFSWEHHTLTEYLVADYFLNLDNPLDYVVNNAVINQEGIVALKPSWTGVLRFLLESSRSNEVFHWLIDFLKQNPESLDDNVAEILVYIDTEELPSKHKEIFDLIYGAYYDRVLWIPAWARTRLAHYVDSKEYLRLKKDLEKSDSITKTFVRRGNVISIIEGLFEQKSKLLTKVEKSFWKSKLLAFINNPEDDGNGVLQRHSLGVLTHFHDENSIAIIQDKLRESQDTLVRDAFLEYCATSTPNAPGAIDNLIWGLKQGSSIYARHGLYKITSTSGIKYFLSQISEDETFIKEFLHHESIFDKEDGDIQLINSIKKAIRVEQSILPILKKLIRTTYQAADLYREERSSFLRAILLIISKQDPDYLFEILDYIRSAKDDGKIARTFYDYEEVIALLLSPLNLEKYMAQNVNFPSQTSSRFDGPIYISKRSNKSNGGKVFKKAIELKLVSPMLQEDSTWEQQEKERHDQQIKEFEKLLEPSPGQYSPEVFSYFRRNYDLISKYLETAKGKTSKQKLSWLTLDVGINKIDPSTFKVTLDKKAPSHFSWTSIASYYDDLVWAANILDSSSISRNRQHLIDFIPFAFSDGISLITELIPQITDSDLEFTNSVIGDKDNNIRYLVPGSYINAVRQYAEYGCKLVSVKPILVSLIQDEDIADHERRSALETLELYTNSSDVETRSLLNNLSTPDNPGLRELSNALLISVFHDQEAIDWRFNKLKEPLQFERREVEGVVHTVSAIENELSDLSFAKPLIGLHSPEYLPLFIRLLDYSFNFPNKNDRKYWEYTNYLWRIVIAFVDKLKDERSFLPLKILEQYIKKNLTNVENANWLEARSKELRASYINAISKIDVTKETNQNG